MAKRHIALHKNMVNISYVHQSKLRSAEYNPRKWDENSTRQLTESIKRFGLIDPIIVNVAPSRKNIVIGGHFRLHVARTLGIADVPVVYVNIPNTAKEKELNLRLNRNTGDWDFELLKEFDVELLLEVGFEDNDLSHIWDENLGIEDDDFDTEQELKEIGTPKTKLGDVFQLGSHRLICGDATNPQIVSKLVNGTLINMVYIDPPYNIHLDYNLGLNGKKTYGGKTKDNKTRDEYKQFLHKLLTNAITVVNPDSHIFCWCDENYIGLLQELYQELGVTSKRVCLWVKNSHNMTPQVAFNKAYEPCVYGVKGTPYLATNVQNLNEVLNKEVGTGNRLIDDVLDLFNIWLVKRIATHEYEHPTEKPATLHEKPLRRCTKAGDTILDLCAGSGSTMVACEQLKRRAFLAEIEPIFCDLIIRRYEKLKGKEAIKCQ